MSDRSLASTVLYNKQRKPPLPEKNIIEENPKIESLTSLNDDSKIIYYKNPFPREKFEALLLKIQTLASKNKQIQLIFYDCQLSFEIPKQIFLNLKDLPQLESLKLNLSCNSLKSSFLSLLRESLIPNKLKTFALDLARCRDLNPDFFKIFDERFFNEFKELTSLKLNFSDNSMKPESIDLKFLEKIVKLEKLEKLTLDLSKNYFQHWKKFCRTLPELKKLLRLKLNFFGSQLSQDYILELCNCIIKCHSLEFFKIDLRTSVAWLQSSYFHEIGYIEAMTSIFRQKFENDTDKFKIWY